MMERLCKLALMLFACALIIRAPADAQNKGEPGKFDFYLLNIAAPADFCHVPGAGPACRPPRSFMLHGLWTQNNEGTYPVNCSAERGPAHIERFLDLTPDLPLLQHEWDKHGTCTALGAEKFFAMERKAYAMQHLPRELKQLEKERALATDDLLRDLYRINPGFPPGSLLLSCKEGKLTAVEACFSKSLKPLRCTHLPACGASVVTLEASPAPIQRQ